MWGIWIIRILGLTGIFIILFVAYTLGYRRAMQEITKHIDMED